MNPYLVIGALIALIAAVLGGVRVGMELKQGEWDAAELTRAEKVIVRERVISREVPKIVTRVVERRVEVEKEVERVVTRIPDLLAADCVLPEHFGFLLVAAANGIDPQTASGTNALAGAYGCREVLEAAIRDLEAGAINTERLRGLQGWAELVTKEMP